MGLLFGRKRNTIKGMKINLDTEIHDGLGGISTPSSAEREPIFPEFVVEQNTRDEEYDLSQLPANGEMTIKYFMARSSEDKRTGRCTYTFQVKNIVSVSGEKTKTPTKKYDEAGEALDKLAAEKAGKNSDSEGGY